MKILWCVYQRKDMIDPWLFKGLHSEIEKLCDFTLIEIDLSCEIGQYNGMVWGCKDRNYDNQPKLSHIDFSQFDVVVCESPATFSREDWKRNPEVPKIACIEDNWLGNKPIIDWTNENFDFIWTKYNTSFFQNNPEIPKEKVFWIPHSVDLNLFQMGQESDRIRDVVLLGASDGYFYPTRATAKQKLSGKPWFFTTQRPIDFVQNQFPVGKDYIKVLQETKVFITCGLIYNCTILKFFETAACGVTLLCPSFPDLLELGFEPMKHFIPINLERLEDQCNTILISPLREKIGQNARKLIEERHSTEVRAKEFISKLKEIVNDYK